MGEINHSLLDGSIPADVSQVEKRFDSLGLSHSSITHPPMRTVADSRKFRDGVPGGYSKNLFLRNKKGKMWLVTLKESTEVDLRHLGDLIGAGRVSFASPERLMSYLGVLPGAVTPLAVINDKSNVVTAVIEASLLEQDPLHFHPCVNTMTTSISKSALLDYMGSCNHSPRLIDLAQNS